MGHDSTRDRPFHLAFDLTQLQEFGSVIYPSAESALLELVARSYEAGATLVDIQVNLGRTGKQVVTLESDVGTPDDQLERLADVSSPLVGSPDLPRVWYTSKIRKYGNLACFAIGKNIEITTCLKGSDMVARVAVDLEKLGDLDRQHRAVCSSSIRKSKRETEKSGTKIVITKISPEANLSPATLDILAAHLVPRLMFADPSFVVNMATDDVSRTSVSNNSWRNVVTKNTRWDFPNKHLLPDLMCEHWEEVRGSVIVAGGVLLPGPPGISLCVNNQPVGDPEFFGADLPITFTSRVTGFLHANFVSIYEDSLKPGDPPTINWEHPEMNKLRNALCAAVHNIHFQWVRQCEESTSALLGKEIESEWFRGLPFAKQSDLLISLLGAEEDEKGRVIEHTLKIIGKLMSPHPKREWRTLHGSITSNKKIMSLYDSKNYYQAVSECIKIYCEKVREISGSSHRSDNQLMEFVFRGTQKKPGKIVLSATAGKANSESIQRGHGFFSQGLICGFKNPAISHGSQTKMTEHGLFTEDDCLDILSLVSYLFRCIENRDYPPVQQEDS